MAYIYKITNSINNFSYIGQTIKTPEERFLEHCYKSHSEKHPTPLHRAMKELGENNFKIEIVEECSVEQLNLREQYWIEFYDSYHNGYNATKGGSGLISVKKSKPVRMMDLNGETIKVFSSIKEACTFLNKPAANRHISKVCHGERVTAYGYKWEFINEEHKHQTYCEFCGSPITKGHKHCLYCQK